MCCIDFFAQRTYTHSCTYIFATIPFRNFTTYPPGRILNFLAFPRQTSNCSAFYNFCASTHASKCI